jgi:hypothetical protein
MQLGLPSFIKSFKRKMTDTDSVPPMSSSSSVSVMMDKDEMLRMCLKQVRDEKTIPSTVLLNGQRASKFSFEYILRKALRKRIVCVEKKKT